MKMGQQEVGARGFKWEERRPIWLGSADLWAT